MKALKNKNNQKGFTLIELMIALALGAVAFIAYAQSIQQEANQMQARKLGTQELYVYNNAVQKFLLDNASTTPGTITGTYNGVNWLKSTTCPGGIGTASDSYLPCNFLGATGGVTTVGAMTFTTTITHSPAAVGSTPKGFSARTVLSRMSTLAPGETGAGTLGLAAMVASASFLVPEAGTNNDPGTVIYCPNLNPFPATMAPLCGTERDQIVMYGFANRSDDTWLRVDHGNVMQNVVEVKSPGTSTNMDPSSDAQINAIDSRNRRHLRNFSRIYNLGPTGENSETENLYIGKKQGDAAIAATTIANNGVIIDADQQILGYLIVQGTIQAQGDISTDQNLNANVDVNSGNDVNAGNDLSVGNNATINGWIQSAESRTSRVVDTDNNAFFVDPSSRSMLNEVITNNIEAIANDLEITTDNLNITRKTGADDVVLNGQIDVSNLRVRKNGSLYNLDELLPNLTLIGSVKLKHNGTVARSSIDSYCGGAGNVRVYIQPLVDEIVTNNNVGAQIRYMERLSTTYRYRALNPYRTSGSKEATNSEAIVLFYCRR